MRERAVGTELLDGPVADAALLADSFREVWGVNRYLGGMAVLQRHLRPWLGRGPLTLLDVAAGTGDVALELRRWASTAGTELRVCLLENHPQVLAIARERTGPVPGMAVVAGDACHLPFATGEFDLAICNLALHHFSESEAIVLLRELERVSRLGWVVADLERHPLAYLSARLLATAVWRNPITRHDGPLSVRRAYHARELRRLADAAEVPAYLHRHFPFRLALVRRRG